MPRSELFGTDDALQCPPCAQGIRDRMQTRLRPQFREWREQYVTKAVIGICVVIFGACYMAKRGGAPDPDWLVRITQGPEIWTGQWWRHLAVVFVHFDIWHIAMNMFSAWYVVRLLERFWGPRVTIGVILSTGLCASALQWTMSSSGIGFSGALFGVCGFLWGQRRHHAVASGVVNKRFQNMLITWLVVGVILTQTGTFPIGNWAHGGGLASGYLLGLLMDGKRRWVAPVVGIVMTLALLVVAQKVVLDLDSGWRRGPDFKQVIRKPELHDQWMRYPDSFQRP